MEKRGFLIIGILILTLPVVIAGISIENPDSKMYNLGKTIPISGYITEAQNIEGLMKFTLICDNTTSPFTLAVDYLILRADEKDFFSKNLKIPKSEKGECYIAIEFQSGNFTDSGSTDLFAISNNLTLNVLLTDYKPAPGSEIIISGSARTLTGENLEAGTAYITLDSAMEKADVLKGSFESKLKINNNIKSGRHKIEVEVADNSGNEGHAEILFEIIAIPTSLEISLDKSTYLPKEEIIIIPLLKDQAGESIKDKAAITLRDPKGVNKLTKVIDTDSEFRIILEEFAIPGTWVIIAESNDYIVESKLVLDIVEEIALSLDNSSLEIRNIGNVDYKKPIEINFQSDEKTYRVVKNINLKLNQTAFFELAKDIPKEGVYSIILPAFPDITGQVVFEGKPIVSSAIVYLLLIMGFIIGGYFAFKAKGRERFKGRKWEHEKLDGQRTLKKMRENPASFSAGKKIFSMDSEEKKRQDIDFLLDKIKKEDNAAEQQGGQQSPAPANIFDFFK